MKTHSATISKRLASTRTIVHDISIYVRVNAIPSGEFLPATQPMPVLLLPFLRGDSDINLEIQPFIENLVNRGQMHVDVSE